jgi:hypothetical protein
MTVFSRLVSRFVLGPDENARNQDRFWLYIVFAAGFLFALLALSLAGRIN